MQEIMENDKIQKIQSLIPLYLKSKVVSEYLKRNDKLEKINFLHALSEFFSEHLLFLSKQVEIDKLKGAVLKRVYAAKDKENKEIVEEILKCEGFLIQTISSKGKKQAEYFICPNGCYILNKKSEIFSTKYLEKIPVSDLCSEFYCEAREYMKETGIKSCFYLPIEVIEVMAERTADIVLKVAKEEGLGEKEIETIRRTYEDFIKSLEKADEVLKSMMIKYSETPEGYG